MTNFKNNQNKIVNMLIMPYQPIENSILFWPAVLKVKIRMKPIEDDFNKIDTTENKGDGIF